MNTQSLRPFLTDIGHYTRLHEGFAMRGYQITAARGVLAFLREGQGHKGCMVFSRQAGKDETLAQLIGFLLLRHSARGGSIVVAAPTAKPQAEITRSRVLERLLANPITRTFVRTSNQTVHVGRARAVFLGAGAQSNARGQTASILLVANEAQDISPERWDAVFEPMGASTNAPTLFMGTVWTNETLLAREMAHAHAEQSSDGLTRLFLADWTEVAKELPAYGERVRSRIRQFGATHPFIRTEYELVALDGDGGLFGTDRQVLLSGSHPRQRQPRPGERYAFLLDVAGADEERVDTPGSNFDPEATRDSTALTIVRLLDDGELQRYEVVDRIAWTGAAWQAQQGAIRAYLRTWNPLVTIVDATGIGYGLYAWLSATERRRRFEPFTFTAQSKSELGWTLVGLIDSGRLQDYDPVDPDPVTAEHWRQVRATTYRIVSAETRRMVWSVPSQSGHDDLVLSLALVGVLEGLQLRPRVATGT